jgi:hypothetical protein
MACVSWIEGTSEQSNGSQAGYFKEFAATTEVLGAAVSNWRSGEFEGACRSGPDAGWKRCDTADLEICATTEVRVARRDTRPDRLPLRPAFSCLGVIINPETFGLPADSRLEIFTEWLPESPEPERTPQPIAADEQTGRITFADDMLRFGADTRLVRGRAFALQGRVEGGEQIQVGK